MKRIVFILACIASMYANAGTFDADKQLEYCSSQVGRALRLLRPYDFKIAPRNILATDKQEGWNCRPRRKQAIT